MKHPQHKGFTLIELAVALTIIALLIGGLAVPLSKRLVEQQYIDTQAKLDMAVEALVGYAVLNRRLPCPDVNTASDIDNRDGLEDVTGSNCSKGTASGAFNYTNSTTATGAVSWGDLPWQTLGLPSTHNADAWNNRLRYAVIKSIAAQSPDLATSLAGANIDIRCGNPNTNIAGYAPVPGCLPNNAGVENYKVTQNAVFVVYSVGPNRFGGTHINSVSASLPFTEEQKALTPDQAVNAPELAGTDAARRQFVSRIRTDAASKAGEFDDLLSFMSSNVLAAKLLNAGVYP